MKDTTSTVMTTKLHEHGPDAPAAHAADAPSVKIVPATRVVAPELQPSVMSDDPVCVAPFTSGVPP